MTTLRQIRLTNLHTLEAFCEENSDDHELCAWCRTAPHGSTMVVDGGAAPVIEIEIVDTEVAP